MGMDPGSLWHFQELFRRISWIAERLLSLEESIQRMEQRLNELENRPTTHIDKIDYSFEHLRVDTLSGTLLIGITQGMDGKVDEFTLGETTTSDLKIGGSSPAGSGPFLRITGMMKTYYESEIHRDIDASSTKYGFKVDPEWRTTIIEDLRGQLDGRILTYIKQAGPDTGDDPALAEQITEKVKGDIRTALDHFFEKTGKESSS